MFAYIVAFGNIPGTGFSPVFKALLPKRTSSSFLSCSQGFYGDLPGYYLKIILNSNNVYEKSQKKEPAEIPVLL
ncbi:hypothetical protein D3H55_18265 [Bacillus salacetis]|uniref:Uncharacterized protein n=1 Tax=Bacillus salacetis TaxID=2315464 RepID=A0A3A1QV49_9BACI|nr:hypothetical protein D3H55_18265 [Bacillus salacetis]